MLLILWLAFPTLGFSQGKAVPKGSPTKGHVSDSIKTPTDSLKTVSKLQKSNQIDAEIAYSAQDSIVFLGNGTGFLHGKSDVKYKNIELKADFVRVKMDSSLVFAHGKLDSIGKRVDDPVFTENKRKG